MTIIKIIKQNHSILTLTAPTTIKIAHNININVECALIINKLGILEVTLLYIINPTKQKKHIIIKTNNGE